LDEAKEKEFNDWMESITFVDKTGKISPHVLTRDESPDPEGDTGYRKSSKKKRKVR